MDKNIPFYSNLRCFYPGLPNSESCLSLPIIAYYGPTILISITPLLTCHVHGMQNMKLTAIDVQEMSQVVSHVKNHAQDEINRLELIGIIVMARTIFFCFTNIVDEKKN